MILDAGPDQAARNETLGLVVTGRVPEECGVQIALIELLCDNGADLDGALHAAAPQRSLTAANALIARGAQIDLPVAAAMGRSDDARRLLPSADAVERHLALALASQGGHIEIVRMLLEAGEDPNRYQPARQPFTSRPCTRLRCTGTRSWCGCLSSTEPGWTFETCCGAELRRIGRSMKGEQSWKRICEEVKCKTIWAGSRVHSAWRVAGVVR